MSTAPFDSACYALFIQYLSVPIGVLMAEQQQQQKSPPALPAASAALSLGRSHSMEERAQPGESSAGTCREARRIARCAPGAHLRCCCCAARTAPPLLCAAGLRVRCARTGDPRGRSTEAAAPQKWSERRGDCTTHTRPDGTASTLPQRECAQHHVGAMIIIGSFVVIEIQRSTQVAIP